MSYRKIDLGSATLSIANGILSDSEIAEVLSGAYQEPLTIEDFNGSEVRYKIYLDTMKSIQDMEDRFEKNISAPDIESQTQKDMTLEDFRGNQERYEFYLKAKEIFQRMEDQREKNISAPDNNTK